MISLFYLIIGLIVIWRGINMLIGRKIMFSKVNKSVIFVIFLSGNLLKDFTEAPYLFSFTILGLLIFSIFFSFGKFVLFGVKEKEFVESFKKILEEKNINYNYHNEYVLNEKYFTLNEKYKIKYKSILDTITIDLRKLIRTKLYNDLKADMKYKFNSSNKNFSWYGLLYIILGIIIASLFFKAG
ncbi:hypothetical protein [Sporohalobacter salinus]|uniref:hypothetical protein n=1 Tax=Sporohalobacter salinus TaxID=1494606 RepID=UPI00195F8F5B|nr:hypothetical protein [Sporohalobacter salinus]MBM7624267.1 hypothetical protein [Sporohalobacter salinus]